MEHQQEGKVLVVTVLDSRLDAKVAVEFKEEILALIQQGHTSIVLNLEAVDFMDSSGLGAVVGCLKALGRKGDLAICGLKEKVLNLFRLTRMDRVFHLFQTKGEAVTQLAAAA